MRDEQLQEWFKAYVEGNARVSFGYDTVTMHIVAREGLVVYETDKSESFEGLTIAVEAGYDGGGMSPTVIRPLRQLATFFDCQVSTMESGDPYILWLVEFKGLPEGQRWFNLILISLVLLMLDKCPFIQGLKPKELECPPSI